MTTPLHRVYDDLGLIRADAGWRILRARRLEDARPVTLVAPNHSAALNRSREALETAAEAHRRIAHPLVPKQARVLDLEGRPVLELGCGAVHDALELWRRMFKGSRRFPYPAADAFISGIAGALRAAHRARHPRTDRQLCIGRLSGANVLLDARGGWHVVGFGHNFPIEDERGRPDYSVPFYEAPELGWGDAPSPEGDYVALMKLRTSGLGAVDLTDALKRILGGLVSSSETTLFELVMWVEQNMVSPTPTQRGTWEDAVRVAEKIRGLMGVKVDPEGFARIASDVLLDSTVEPPDGESVLCVGPEGEWIRWNAEPPQRLRGAMRRMLLVLAEKQCLGSVEPVRTVDLIDIGWPDEQPGYESALNRVYVTLNRLRKIVPESVIERFDEGYRLAPHVAVRRLGLDASVDLWARSA